MHLIGSIMDQNEQGSEWALLLILVHLVPLVPYLYFGRNFVPPGIFKMCKVSLGNSDSEFRNPNKKSDSEIKKMNFKCFW